jgi:hypothetical protein
MSQHQAIRKPLIEHKLIAGLMKHWYLQADGAPRFHGETLSSLDKTRQLLTYVLVFNVWDGRSHVEVFLKEDRIDVLGFLARAWEAGKASEEILGETPETLYHSDDLHRLVGGTEHLHDMGKDRNIRLQSASYSGISGAIQVRALNVAWADAMDSIQINHPLRLQRENLFELSGKISRKVSAAVFHSSSTSRFLDSRSEPGFRLSREQAAPPSPRAAAPAVSLQAGARRA